ncbi:MAG: peptidase domain-containing ABC transporter [Flammeovirgaceae bacterium]
MKSTLFVPIAKRMAMLIEHGYKLFNLKDEYQNNEDFGEDVDAFINGLTDKAQRIDLAILRNGVPKDSFMLHLKTVDYPVLTFVRLQWNLVPAIFFYDSRGALAAYYYQDGEEVMANSPEKLLELLWENDDNNVEALTPFPLHSMVSDDGNIMRTITGPVSRLLKLLNAEKKDIFYIYFYSVLIAAISLTLPVGVQSIMELISGGVFFSSIVLLMGIVIVGVLLAGILQLMQYSIVEILERRVFVKAAFEFCFRIPQVRSESILKNYAPELMNRFFDVLTIQKGLPKLLIDLTSSVLQIIFGLLLVSLYHPFFIFFGIGLLATLGLTFYITGPKGLATSLVESKYKYKVAHWLEELARTLYSFKLAGHTDLPLRKMDHYVENYLHYRKNHFRVLMTQFINVVGFRVLVTGGLLIIGGFLVIEREITLGQFVASEIVVVTIMNASEKFVISMSTIYDMLTAVEKLGSVTDIPLEKKGGISIPYQKQSGMKVEVTGLSYKYPEASNPTLKNLNLEIEAGARVCLSGYSSAGKNTLVRVLTGILDSYQGTITLNNLSLRDINLNSLRDNVAKNISSEDLFDGTILENISMGKSRIGYQDVVWALESVGILDMINHLPKGLQTQVVPGGKQFSHTIATKLLIARCIAERPQLLILNDLLHELEREDKLRILQFLIDKNNPWTLICVSNDPLIMSACDRIVFMKEGQILHEAPYEEMLGRKDFKEAILCAPISQSYQTIIQQKKDE